jgi:hypothetical protein
VTVQVYRSKLVSLEDFLSSKWRRRGGNIGNLRYDRNNFLKDGKDEKKKEA